MKWCISYVRDTPSIYIMSSQRKKVKLAVLKFYKVDSNDKVTRLRRECPHEICGPGVFMAMHFNRYYCGKCHLTYLIKKGEGDA